MNRTDVLIAIAEVARSGGATAPEDAISQLAMIIDGAGHAIAKNLATPSLSGRNGQLCPAASSALQGRRSRHA